MFNYSKKAKFIKTFQNVTNQKLMPYQIQEIFNYNNLKCMIKCKQEFQEIYKNLNNIKSFIFRRIQLLDSHTLKVVLMLIFTFKVLT